jgi:sulfatase maturation enzyme AslB (radical SAM superfamily)
MDLTKPLCTVPFTRAFVLPNGKYRDCCATIPTKISQPNESFATWWNGTELSAVRRSLWSTKFPAACETCKIQEGIHNTSFRLAANKEISALDTHYTIPDTWHVMFGNKCNLACWSCNENASSLIAHHKQQIKVLPIEFTDPNIEFAHNWPNLKDNILDSYNHHDTIRISILGGEPVYNKEVIKFLESLVAHGLSTRTTLEITTNGTILGKQLIELFWRGNWKYICVFISVDAVGKSAEWIRYGSNWTVIEENITQYKNTVEYVEIQSSLSILSLLALPQVVDFCKQHGLPHTIHTISYPEFMDIRNWNGNTDILQQPFVERGLGEYLSLVGSNQRAETTNQLQAYIQQFSSIRRPLNDFDPALASFLGVN